jgi:hypothetical protein
MSNGTAIRSGGTQESEAQKVFTMAKNILASVGGRNAAAVTLQELGLTTAEHEALAKAAMKGTATERVAQCRALLKDCLNNAGFSCGSHEGQFRFQPPHQKGEFLVQYGIDFHPHLCAVQVKTGRLTPVVEAQMREVLRPVVNLGWSLEFTRGLEFDR